MLPACPLLLAFALAQAATPLPATEPVFLELTSGRGTLLAGEDTAQLSARDGEQWVEGRGHLSLMASATAVLRWHARASIQLSGPCEFEWEASTPGQPLEWSFETITRAEIESRRSELRIRLGESWVVWMPPGAMSLRGLPPRQVELLHEAGAPPTYQWQGAAAHTRPVQSATVGERVRLGMLPPDSRPDMSSDLEGRAHFTWPWRKESEPVHAWGYRDWPWLSNSAPRPVTVRIVQAPHPKPIHTPQADVILTAPPAPTPLVTELPSEPVIVEHTPTPTPLPVEPPSVVVTMPPPPEPTPAPVAPPAPPAPDAKPDGEGTWGWEANDTAAAGSWRGQGEDGYRPLGEYHIQLRTGVLTEELPDGGVRFWIPEHFKGSAWVLGPRLDARIDPGGSIEFGPTGALRQHSGGVRVLAAMER